jgi:GT2 family glycosyltransferase
MDAQRWASAQRDLRRAVRVRRRTSDGHSPLPPGQPAPAIRTQAPDVARSEHAPLASVIVVCWNSGDVLGRCLDKLLAQQYPSFEIIVVDDGSEDDTLHVAERALGSGRLKIARSGSNRGCPHARNLGVQHAAGEIIAFIDADGFADPDWLTRVVECFDDETVGAVASTVFFDANPSVVNGAGGVVNRQGWAADLSMNESYERAEIVREALYPMGCGMAVRRTALERVGQFDDRMLNYYDDVDYGTRLWRAGYRVVVAPDAWIDHGFGGSGADSGWKQLLCERHRMRVVLKHAPLRSLLPWVRHEARTLRRASRSRRLLKLRAMGWNACHLASVVGTRRRLHGAPQVPDRLFAPSWGDEFPAGLPSRLTPHPELAQNRIDMGDPRSDGQLIHGWFPPEPVGGRTYRWAGPRAAVLVRLNEDARRLRLEFAYTPVDIGCLDLEIRRVGSSDPLASQWSTSLKWQYIARSVENHPINLPAGDYEVVFSARDAWSDPPRETRVLAVALAGMSFESSYELSGRGLEMDRPDVEQQLVRGWFEPEQSAARSYRWGTAHAAAVVSLIERASSVTLIYCLPPVPSGVKVTACPLGHDTPVWTAVIPWQDAAWHEDTLPVELAPGDYVLCFDAETAWSNPGQQEPALWPENRLLGFALASVAFGRAE